MAFEDANFPRHVRESRILLHVTCSRFFTSHRFYWSRQKEKRDGFDGLSKCRQCPLIESYGKQLFLENELDLTIWTLKKNPFNIIITLV